MKITKHANSVSQHKQPQAAKVNPSIAVGQGPHPLPGAPGEDAHEEPEPEPTGQQSNNDNTTTTTTTTTTTAATTTTTTAADNRPAACRAAWPAACLPPPAPGGPGRPTARASLPNAAKPNAASPAMAETRPAQNSLD